jgi:hypothetical protein
MRNDGEIGKWVNGEIGQSVSRNRSIGIAKSQSIPLDLAIHAEHKCPSYLIPGPYQPDIGEWQNDWKTRQKT